MHILHSEISYCIAYSLFNAAAVSVQQLLYSLFSAAPVSVQELSRADWSENLVQVKVNCGFTCSRRTLTLTPQMWIRM